MGTSCELVITSTSNTKSTVSRDELLTLNHKGVAGVSDNHQLAERLMELYFVPGSSYYEGPVNVPNKEYRHIKREITLDRIIAHLEGQTSIGAPSCNKNLVKWITVECDCLDLSLIEKASSLLRGKVLPCYVSFSGQKGYHLTVFLSKPTSLYEAQRVSAEVKRIVDGAGLPYDKISPSPNGKGGDCIKLPLGIHPETGNRCYFVNDTMQPVEDSLGFLSIVKTVGLDGKSGPVATQEFAPGRHGRHIDTDTGEIIQAPLPQSISRRPCVNKLWREGLQAPNTRHSATCVIANAIARSTLIPPHEKEHALIDWVSRMFPKARDAGYLKVDSNLDFVVNEARRMLSRYSRYGNYAELCENQVFKAAMRSACENEFECKLEQNHGYVNFKLLLRLGVFSAQNAKPKGIGKSAMAIYFAIEDIAQDYPLFEYEGMEVFSLSTQQLVCLANCSKPTVIRHRDKLVELGLLVKVSNNAVPTEVMQNIPKGVWPNFYALPELTEEVVRAMLNKLRNNPGGKVALPSIQRPPV